MKIRIAFAALALPAALAAQAAPPRASAPKSPVPAAAVGTWEGKSMIGPKDSVVATYVLTVGADGKIMLALNGQPPMTSRLLAAGGDSTVTENGPYISVLKKGLNVTTKTTTHFKGNAMTGTFEAKYSDGSSLKGKSAGAKKGAK